MTYDLAAFSWNVYQVAIPFRLMYQLELIARTVI